MTLNLDENQKLILFLLKKNIGTSSYGFIYIYMLYFNVGLTK